jgi:hypothetical protein
MTINKNQFLEMAKKILRHGEGLRDQPIMHPTREWFIGLGIGIGIFMVVAAGSAYTYWNNKEININFPEDTTEVTTYRESQVKDALKQYRARDTDRESLVSQFSLAAPAPVTPEATTTNPFIATSTASITAQ